MKSNAPWSVKGIERDARETAKEAAKREGMTVGEWLNQMIYTAGEPAETGGEVEGLKLRDIVTAIDHLHKRVAESATQSNEAITEVTRKMGEMVERVQRLERDKPEGGRDRVDALKALEKAVAQVAVQFSNSQKSTLERLDLSEQRLQKLADRTETGGAGDASDVGHLKDAIDGLQTRMARTERLAGEAAQASGGADPQFVESTGNRLRVLGDEIKRSGDQVRALEATIAKLAQQMEAAERRSAEGVQKTAETLAELREKFSGGQLETPNREDIAALVADQTKDTIDRVDRLQSSFETMIARLENVGGERAPASEIAPETEIAADEIALDEPTPQIEDTQTDDVSSAEPSPLDELELIQEDSEDASASPEASAEPAATDEDEDDDFFAFADDIDASIDDDTRSDDDDFSFELDDETEPAQAEPAGGEAALDNNLEGASILSEVQQAFSGSVEPASEDDNAADTDLDELLAGLDDLSEPKPDTDADEPADEPAANETTNAAPEIVEEKKEDLLTSIRRKSREETATRSAEESAGKTARRNLTPKQKAILAARRRRLAAQSGEDKSDADPVKRAATKRALGAAETEPHLSAENTAEPATSQTDDVDEPAGLGGKLGALRGKLPFLSGKKKADDIEHDLEEEDVAQNGDRAALETMKKTTSARPVTLALGVGIFLAVGLLFFTIKDFIFAPRDTSGQQTAAVQSPDATTAPTGAEINAPAPPAIDPRVLYRDAMTALTAGETDAEVAIAIDKLEQSALLGHPPAQLQLGELYKTGQGVDQDLDAARTWFRRAANGGNVLAMHRAGVMTARGEGGGASTPEAIAWFEQAANRGLVDSQYNLGAIYHPSGEPGANSSIQDAGKAYYWYSLAVRNGDTQAEPLAAGVGATLSDAQRAEIDQSIADWEALPSDAEANTLATG